MPTIASPTRRKLLPSIPSVRGGRDPYNPAVPILLGSLLLCTTTLASQVSLWILLIFLGCAVWRVVAERRGWALPSLVIRACVFLPSIGLVTMLYGLQPTANSLMALLIVLLSLKVLELRTARDFTVVALLGYFMVMSGLFYDQSFSLCLYLFIAVLLNTLALIRVHVGVTAKTFWPTLRLACGLLLQAAPLVVLLFVIFPRVHVDFFRRLNNGKGGMTGMSDHLQPGSVESLAQSSTTAFRVHFKARDSLPVSELYWRGLVLSKCDAEMSWRAVPSPSGTPRRTTDHLAEGLWWSVRCVLVAPYNPLAADGIEQAITVMPQGERWLFALDRPLRVTSTSSAKPQFAEGTRTLSSPQTLFSNTNYTVVSETGGLNPFSLSPEARDFYTQLPFKLSPRVAALVQGWKNGGASPPAVIRAAQNFFGENKFTYTLSPGSLPRSNALEYFLFKSKRGFCEHYAAAFCSLMRGAGIPARIVIGYQGGELNTWSGWYSVRQSDAHAWCEVWLEGRGWQRQDPTSFVAPERVNLGAENFATNNGLNLNSGFGQLDRFDSIGWVHWLRHNVTMVWESVDQQWNLMVIGYDPDTQFAFMQDLGLGNLTLVAGVALAVAAFFSILILGAALMRLMQGLPAWRRTSPEEAARAAYNRFCKRVAAAARIERKPSEGPLDFAARAVARRPDLAPEIERITGGYVNLRYTLGNPDQVKTALAALVGAIRAFRPRVRKAASTA